MHGIKTAHTTEEIKIILLRSQSIERNALNKKKIQIKVHF